MRLLLTVSGTLLIGAATWLITAFLASEILSRGPGGTREGANAMAAAFFVAPTAAVLAMSLAAWLLWRLTASPARHGPLGIGIAVGFVLFLIGAVYAFSPTYDPGIEWPKSMKGQAQVEVRLPAALATPNLSFDLRCGSGTLHATPNSKAIQRDPALATVPIAFPLTGRQTAWIFAIMQGDKQIAVGDLDLHEPLTETSPWTDWKPLQPNIQFRFRTAVVPR